MIRVQFLLESGRRRSVEPGFFDSEEECLSTLPGYTRNQITTVGVYALKVKK